MATETHRRRVACAYCSRTEPRGVRVARPTVPQWGVAQEECCDGLARIPYDPRAIRMKVRKRRSDAGVRRGPRKAPPAGPAVEAALAQTSPAPAAVMFQGLPERESWVKRLFFR